MAGNRIAQCVITMRLIAVNRRAVVAATMRQNSVSNLILKLRAVVDGAGSWT
jgi:hypothetical protein